MSSLKLAERLVWANLPDIKNQVFSFKGQRVSYRTQCSRHIVHVEVDDTGFVTMMSRQPFVAIQPRIKRLLNKASAEVVVPQLSGSLSP
jgi:hypothetical protein